MGRNWIRYIKVQTGDGGQSYDVSNMRIKFRITHQTNASPNIANVRIYNLSAQTANTIFQQRFSRVTIEAGYKDHHGEIFNGWVEQKRKGRETPTETFLDIIAQDGVKAYNNAKNNETLKENSTAKDVVEKAVKAMQKEEDHIKLGYVGPKLEDIKYPLPYVMFGMSRKFLRDVAHASHSQWFITSGEVNFLKRDNDSIPGGPIEVNANTGMIGSPTQTYQGINVRALINPDFKPGKLIHLNNDSIQTGEIDLANQGTFERGALLAGLSPSGTYKILYIDWVGDTEGQPWYAEITCYSKEEGPPKGVQGQAPIVQ